MTGAEGKQSFIMLSWADDNQPTLALKDSRSHSRLSASLLTLEVKKDICAHAFHEGRDASKAETWGTFQADFQASIQLRKPSHTG